MQFLVLQAAAVVGGPRSLGLLPGVFLLLAGEETLEVFGALLFVSLGALSQQQLADLRNSSFFCGCNLLKPILEHGVEPHTEEYLPCSIA